jgi:hypothetical protein
VVALVRVSVALKEERAERERQRQEWEEERKRRQEREKRDAIEQHLRHDLSVRAADWAEARQLHAFLDEFERAFLARNDLDHDSRGTLGAVACLGTGTGEYAREGGSLDLRLRTRPQEPGQWRFLPTATAADLAAYLSSWVDSQSFGQGGVLTRLRLRSTRGGYPCAFSPSPARVRIWFRSSGESRYPLSAS